MGAADPDTPTDAELVHAARAGDVSAVGTLLARYQPSLRAVAYSVVGYGPDAEDAVQEAGMAALRHLDSLRDPGAVGPWLRTVVRNACRTRLRRRSEVPLDVVPETTLASRGPDPAELLDQHATRDWIWHALEELTPPLRLVVMLRYFSAASTYQEIAAVCGIPIGTVRSRLNQARNHLARALLATADDSYDDIAARNQARRREAEDLLAAIHRGDAASAFTDSWAAAVEIRRAWDPVPAGQAPAGPDSLVRELDQDMTDGVRSRLTDVTASRDLVLWEMDLISPADDPTHCPPSVMWVQHLDAGRVDRVGLFHPLGQRT